jgi:hypothetical protein
MRIIFLIIWLTSVHFGICQNTNLPLQTKKYAGIFSYGSDVENGRVGQITIFPETDSTVLFYFESNRGKPSYNMGSLYGRVKLLQDTGVFFQKIDSEVKGCKFGFKFAKGQLTLTTLDNLDDCGFGYGVYVQGKFKQISKKVPLSFTDLEGKEVYFKKTTPEDYDNNR